MTKSRRSILTKLVTFVLALLIAFYAVPSIVYSETIDALSSVGENSEAEENGSSSDGSSGSQAAKIPVFEVEELREESVKHFRLSDGSYVAAQYPSAVHRLDPDGKWQDIDNTLKASGSEFATSDARVKFAKKITGNELLFTLHENNTKISFSLDGAKKKTVGAVKEISSESTSDETELGKLMNLKSLSSCIIYEDILDGVDIEYILSSNDIKENIIVKTKKDSYVYTFTLKLNNLSAELSDEGCILILNSSAETAYTIPAPVIYDANGNYADSGVGEYSLSDNGNGSYTLTVTADPEWMNAETTAFPVTVDPPIYSSASNVTDVSISMYEPDLNTSSDTALYVEYARRIHWKLNTLPTLPTSAYITNATISMKTTGTIRYDQYIAAHEVLTSWTSTLTWTSHTASSPAGQIGSRAIDYQRIPEAGTYTWNITTLVQKWYNGSNFGVAFMKVEGTNAEIAFESNDSATSSNRPSLAIYYQDMKGIEAYWPYSSQSAGIAGSGSINLATGQLTLAIPTLSTTDSLMPYTPTLVYNSGLANHMFTYANNTSFLGYGFKLNICETLHKNLYYEKNGTVKYNFTYSDADGTEHEFYETSTGSGTYTDSSGLQKWFMLQSDGSIIMTDDTKFTKTFSPVNSSDNWDWYLTKIADRNGNSVVFTYDTLLRPTKVSMKPNELTAIDFLELRYYSSGNLKMVYNPTSKDAVVFRYSNTYNGSISTTAAKYLRQVSYARGTSSVTDANWESFATSASNCTNITLKGTAEYEYNSLGSGTDGYIKKAKDNLHGQEINYFWSSSKKITSVRHYAGLSLGQYINISYGTGYTEIESSGTDDKTGVTADNIITRYVFDSYGRSKSIYSTSYDKKDIYGATVGEYESEDVVKNNLKNQAYIGGSSVNYLLIKNEQVWQETL